MLRSSIVAILLGFAASEKIINVVIKSTMSDSRPLSYARGSSACWGIPGLAPQQDGSINVVPDEGNFACPCNDNTCDYYAKLLMPLYLDSRLDIFHKHPELIGQVDFLAHGKNVSGTVQWTYSCNVIDAEAKHKISCDPVTSPDPSLYFKAYQVSLSDPSVPMASQDSCSLYAIDGDKCLQSDLDCAYTKYAKVAEKSLKDGTCASQGYTVKGGQTTKSYPVIGDITITEYTKPSIIFMGSQDTCSLYQIAGDTCGQSDLDCKYTKYAKLAEKSLKDGTCASQGYTVKGSTTTKTYPVIGDITITKYTKPSGGQDVIV